jgi:hypothetical protein
MPKLWIAQMPGKAVEEKKVRRIFGGGEEQG